MKDKIFNSKKMKISDFKFNKKVAQSFDDMVSRSVPKYKEVQNDIISLSLNYIKDNSKILDLGCSTGSLLIDLSKSSKKKNLKFIGIDSSDNMIDIAKNKILRNKKKKKFRIYLFRFFKI